MSDETSLLQRSAGGEKYESKSKYEPGNSGPPPSLKYSAFAIFCSCEMLCSLVILLEPARAARSISRIVLLLEGCVAYCRNICAASGFAAHLREFFVVLYGSTAAAIGRIEGARDIAMPKVCSRG